MGRDDSFKRLLCYDINKLLVFYTLFFIKEYLIKCEAKKIVYNQIDYCLFSVAYLSLKGDILSSFSNTKQRNYNKFSIHCQLCIIYKSMRKSVLSSFYFSSFYLFITTFSISITFVTLNKFISNVQARW